MTEPAKKVEAKGLDQGIEVGASGLTQEKIETVIKGVLEH